MFFMNKYNFMRFEQSIIVSEIIFPTTNIFLKRYVELLEAPFR